MSLEELHQKLKEQHLIGYWTIPNTSTGFREPQANFRPFLWKWNEKREALDQAAQFIRFPPSSNAKHRTGDSSESGKTWHSAT
jgi:gentisate 1,2-dioxygenase